MIYEESRGFDTFVYKHYTVNKGLKLSFSHIFLSVYGDDLKLFSFEMNNVLVLVPIMIPRQFQT